MAWYRAGGSKPKQNKTVTPKATSQTVKPDAGKELAQVTVNGDADLKAENIKKGINIFNVLGQYLPSGQYVWSKNEIATFYKDGKTVLGDCQYLGLNARMAALNDDAYLFYGGGGTTIFKLNGSAWRSVGNSPVQVNYLAVATYNGKIHILGDNVHYTYDGSNWQQISSGINFNATYFSAVEYKNKLHVIGSNAHYTYDGSNWEKLANLPVTFSRPSICVYDDNIYLQASSGATGYGYKYDGLNWTTTAIIGRQNVEINTFTMGVSNNTLYGLHTQDGSSNSVLYKYNKTTNKWSSIDATNTGGQWAYNCGCVINDNFYALVHPNSGGTTNGFLSLATKGITVGDFVEFVASDNSAEYPEFSIQNGFYYTKIDNVPYFLAKLFNCSRFVIDEVTFASDTKQIKDLVFPHSLGEIPKVSLIYAVADWETIQSVGETGNNHMLLNLYTPANRTNYIGMFSIARYNTATYGHQYYSGQASDTYHAINNIHINNAGSASGGYVYKGITYRIITMV